MAESRRELCARATTVGALFGRHVDLACTGRVIPAATALGANAARRARRESTFRQQRRHNSSRYRESAPGDRQNGPKCSFGLHPGTKAPSSSSPMIRKRADGDDARQSRHLKHWLPEARCRIVLANLCIRLLMPADIKSRIQIYNTTLLEAWPSTSPSTAIVIIVTSLLLVSSAKSKMAGM